MHGVLGSERVVRLADAARLCKFIQRNPLQVTIAQGPSGFTIDVPSVIAGMPFPIHARALDARSNQGFVVRISADEDAVLAQSADLAAVVREAAGVRGTSPPSIILKIPKCASDTALERVLGQHMSMLLVNGEEERDAATRRDAVIAPFMAQMIGIAKCKVRRTFVGGRPDLEGVVSCPVFEDMDQIPLYTGMRAGARCVSLSQWVWDALIKDHPSPEERLIEGLRAALVGCTAQLAILRACMDPTFEHRDLHVDNVMVCEMDGVVTVRDSRGRDVDIRVLMPFIIDFGLACSSTIANVDMQDPMLFALGISSQCVSTFFGRDLVTLAMSINGCLQRWNWHVAHEDPQYSKKYSKIKAMTSAASRFLRYVLRRAVHPQVDELLLDHLATAPHVFVPPVPAMDTGKPYDVLMLVMTAGHLPRLHTEAGQHGSRSALPYHVLAHRTETRVPVYAMRMVKHLRDLTKLLQRELYDPREDWPGYMKAVHGPVAKWMQVLHTADLANPHTYVRLINDLCAIHRGLPEPWQSLLRGRAEYAPMLVFEFTAQKNITGIRLSPHLHSIVRLVALVKNMVWSDGKSPKSPSLHTLGWFVTDDHRDVLRNIGWSVQPMSYTQDMWWSQDEGRWTKALGASARAMSDWALSIPAVAESAPRRTQHREMMVPSPVSRKRARSFGPVTPRHPAAKSLDEVISDGARRHVNPIAATVARMGHVSPVDDSHALMLEMERIYARL